VKRSFSILLVWSLPFITVLAGVVPTAKKAADLANTEAKTGGPYRVLRVDGENADSDLRLRQWDITVYSGDRANKAMLIRIKDGIVVSTTSAVRLFDDARWSNFGRNFSGYSVAEIIQTSRWKLDSPDVLARVAALQGLEKLQLTDAKMSLRKLSDGDVPAIWRVKVKARSKTQPGREGWIGAVDLSAETGEVIKNDLHSEHLTD